MLLAGLKYWNVLNSETRGLNINECWTSCAQACRYNQLCDAYFERNWNLLRNQMEITDEWQIIWSKLDSSYLWLWTLHDTSYKIHAACSHIVHEKYPCVYLLTIWESRQFRSVLNLLDFLSSHLLYPFCSICKLNLVSSNVEFFYRPRTVAYCCSASLPWWWTL